jgi:glutamyl-tRNA reductase
LQIHCLGLNHKHTPVGIRERLAFSEEQIRTALSRLRCGGIATPLTELVILSTCNRIELYAVASETAFEELELFLAETRDAPRELFRPHLYHYSNMQAASHLLDVAAGLDSLVIGEAQILGQITRSLELARGQGTTGPLLNRLFQTAIHAGKRARSETAISHNPASVSSLAASLAENATRPLESARVVILGAGEMAELAVEALRKRGVRQVRVVNRTLERAHALAERWNAQATTFENLEACLAEADILIASTGAPHTLVSSQMVAEAMRRRRERPLVLIDIAVPRDIDPEVAHLPGVSLYDIDGLNAQLEQSLAGRAAEAPKVRAILAQELAAFNEYLNSLDMLPLIAEMRQQAEVIRRAELEKTLRRLPGLSEAERAHLEAMTQSLVKKLFDTPTHRLRAEAACPHAPEYATVARTLFGLQAGDGACGFSGQICPMATAADWSQNPGTI